MSPRRRDRERGGILPLVLGMLLVLAAAFFGATTVGRVVIAKGEAQRAADAACLSMATIVKVEGLQVVTEQETRAGALGRANTSLPLTYAWNIHETLAEVQLECRATATVQAPAFVFTGGQLQVSATSHGVAPQQTITNAEKRYPHLALILDYSGSMQRNWKGDYNQSSTSDKGDRADDSINTLIGAARKLLDKGYEFRYGMAIFASTVFYSTNTVSLDNAAAMKDYLNQNVTTQVPCPYFNNVTACETASADALKAGYDMLVRPGYPPEEALYVLFVSDGEPSHFYDDPEPLKAAARQQAHRLWDLGATIFTLHVMNNPDDQTSLKAFMVSISGNKEEEGVEVGKEMRYYYNASDEATMEKFFVRLGSALACQIGPISPAPPDPNKVHVYLREANKDVPIANSRTATNIDPGLDGIVPADQIGDLWDTDEPFHDGDWFYYDSAKRMVYVTPDVCDKVQKQDDNVIIRFQGGSIVD